MPPGAPTRRVVITGLGVLSCCGSGKDAFFDGLLGQAPPGERLVTDFDPLQYFEAKEARQTDRFAQLSLASAAMALSDSGEIDAEPLRTGVIFGTGVGGLETLQEQIGTLVLKGPRRVSPRLVPLIMCNAGAAAISIRYGFQGPCETVVTACASGTQAIGNAFRLIATGRCDVMVTGGAEAAMTPVGDDPAIGTTAFRNMTALSTSGISRPFDTRRDGFVMAEGAACLVLEELEHATARGAHIYAEILGAASTADAFHVVAPAPKGAGARACMEIAIEDAGLVANDITHINGHGTSTPDGDLAEAHAIEEVFGHSSPPVTSIKGITGHALGAAGAIEAVAVVLTIERNLIPPTAGLEELDPEISIDAVMGTPRELRPGPVLSNSFGFGGHNGCLVIAPSS